MFLLSPLVSLLGTYLQARAIGKLGVELGDYADKWFRLVASVIITSYVVFAATWGAVTLALWGGGKLLAQILQYPELGAMNAANIWVALVAGFAAGLLITALTVWNLWRSNPLTKGIPVAVPSWLADLAVKEDVTITTRST